MTYAAKLLADSIGGHGVRLTTFEVTFPRFLLAEINTHRMLSRNSASSRAIPTEKQIERVRQDPFIPTFNSRVKGMGVGEALSEDEQAEAEAHWLDSADQACASAENLLHVDKSRANRLLEPFTWHTAIISGTEWQNFFNLRDHSAAQPEMQTIAKMMRGEYDGASPQELNPGEWHLPLVFDSDREWQIGRVPSLPEVSAGRCARVSYDTHNNSESPELSKDRWEGLWPRAHWSPGEHPAQCWDTDQRFNNYTGWKQLRAHYPNEAIFTG